jgi:hypothetical protein
VFYDGDLLVFGSLSSIGTGQKINGCPKKAACGSEPGNY